MIGGVLASNSSRNREPKKGGRLQLNDRFGLMNSRFRILVIVQYVYEELFRLRSRLSEDILQRNMLVKQSVRSIAVEQTCRVQLAHFDMLHFQTIWQLGKPLFQC